MTCQRTVGGNQAQALAATAPPFGPGLDDTAWVSRVEVWETDDTGTAWISWNSGYSRVYAVARRSRLSAIDVTDHSTADRDGRSVASMDGSYRGGDWFRWIVGLLVFPSIYFGRRWHVHHLLAYTACTYRVLSITPGNLLAPESCANVDLIWDGDWVFLLVAAATLVAILVRKILVYPPRTSAISASLAAIPLGRTGVS